MATARTDCRSFCSMFEREQCKRELERRSKGLSELLIDLRSDTVTKPTAAMRAAMAAAEGVFGRETAIFVPTGTMGNVIAMRLHTQHGQEVLCESRAHVLDWEMAMMSAFAGCQARTV